MMSHISSISPILRAVVNKNSSFFFFFSSLFCSSRISCSCVICCTLKLDQKKKICWISKIFNVFITKRKEWMALDDYIQFHLFWVLMKSHKNTHNRLVCWDSFFRLLFDGCWSSWLINIEWAKKKKLNVTKRKHFVKTKIQMATISTLEATHHTSKHNKKNIDSIYCEYIYTQTTNTR